MNAIPPTRDPRIKDSEIANSAGDGFLISCPFSLARTSVHDNAGFGIYFGSSDNETPISADVAMKNNAAWDIGVSGSPAPTPAPAG